jgi:hypothetical protein
MTQEPTHPIIEGAMSQGRLRQEVGLVVQQELEIAGITEASFSALKEEAQAVATIEVTDEDTLAQVQKVITKCVRMRSTIKGAIEPGKKYAHQLHKCYTSNENEFTSTVDAIEAPLKEKKMAFLAEIDRKRKEAEEAEQRRQQERRTFAMQCGFIPDLHEWVNGTTRITDNQLITHDAEVWKTLERSMRGIWEEAEERRRYKEAKMLADAEALRQQEADIARRQKELEERGEKMREAMNTSRRNELMALGCVEYVKNGFPFIGINGLWSLPPDNLHAFSDAEWESKLLAAKLAVEERNLALKEAQEREAREALIADRVKRLREAGWEDNHDRICLMENGNKAADFYPHVLADWREDDVDVLIQRGQAELTRREAARQEQLRLEAEAAARKRLEEEAARKERDEAERQAKMGDAEKWEEFVEAVKAAAPKMSSSIGQHAVKYVVDTVEKVTPGVRRDLGA